MSGVPLPETPLLDRFVEALGSALGDDLVAVLLHGSLVRGDFHRTTSDLNVLLVLANLAPRTLARLRPPLRKWTRQGQPFPLLFTKAGLRDACDVYPLQFLDLAANHKLLFGDNPLTDLAISGKHLRIQCERELRDLSSALHRSFVLATEKPRSIKRILVEAFPRLLFVLRGCLRLYGSEPPIECGALVEAFCRHAAIEPDPILQVSAIRSGESSPLDPALLYDRFDQAIQTSITRIDRFVPDWGGPPTGRAIPSADEPPLAS